MCNEKRLHLKQSVTLDLLIKLINLHVLYIMDMVKEPTTLEIHPFIQAG